MVSDRDPGPAEHSTADEVLVERSVALAAALLDAAHRTETGTAGRQRRRLARLVGDDESRAFVQALTDQVPRIRQDRRAAERFHDIVTTRGTPAVAGPLDRLALAVGARVAPLLPGPVMKLVDRRLRQEAAGIVLSAEDPALARHLRKRRARGNVILVDGVEVAHADRSWFRERADVQIGPEVWRFTSQHWASDTLVGELDGITRFTARRSGFFRSTWTIDVGEELELAQSGLFSARLVVSRGGTPIGEARRSGLFTSRPRLSLAEALDTRAGCFVLWVAHVELDRQSGDAGGAS